MTYATGMLAVQTLSSCFTTSTIHYDGGGGRTNGYCEYKGKRIMIGDTYEPSSSEKCTCSESGLECCRNKKSRKSHRSGHHEAMEAPVEISGDFPSFDGSPGTGLGSLGSESFDWPGGPKKSKTSRRRDRLHGEEEPYMDQLSGSSHFDESFGLLGGSKKRRKSRRKQRKHRFEESYMDGMLGPNGNFDTFTESLDMLGGLRRGRKAKRKQRKYGSKGSSMANMFEPNDSFGSFYDAMDIPAYRFAGSRPGRRNLKKVMKHAIRRYHSFDSRNVYSFAGIPLKRR